MKYIGRSSARMLRLLNPDTTPTMVMSALLRPRPMRRPMALSRGKKRLANASLTIATGCVPARSASVNSRPAMIRTPKVLKNAGLTVAMSRAMSSSSLGV
jgi:hypothetical protein